MTQPKISLEQWATFKAVVDEGSFAKAAEALNKSQSSVSYMLSKMEERLPGPALEISGRKAHMTELGKLLYRQASTLLEQAIAIDKTAEYIASGWEQEVVIAADALVPMGKLFCALQQFSQTSKYTRVRILETTLSGTDEALFSRKVNIALSPNIPAGFLGTPLWHIRMIPVVATTHELAVTHEHSKFSTPITEQELAQHRQIVIRDSGIKREQNTGWLGSEQRWTVSHFASCIEAVKAGLGFAFIPEDKIEQALQDRVLTRLPLTMNAERRLTVNLILADYAAAGPATKAIAAKLIELHPLVI